MDIEIKFPSFQEFYSLVNGINSNQDDLAFQEEWAIKAGHSSWDDYLRFQHYMRTNAFNDEALSNEIENSISDINKATTSFPLLLNKHFNSSIFDDKQNVILNKIKTFPKGIQNRFNSIESRIGMFYNILFLDQFKGNIQKIKQLIAVYKAIQIQYLHVKPYVSKEIEKIITYLEGTLLINTKEEQQKSLSTNFYFPDKVSKLKPLHDALVKNGFIKQNEDFEKIFETEYPLYTAVKKNKWLSINTITSKKNSIRMLFYLLYALNDKKHTFNGIIISTVAYRLFEFENNPTENSLRVSFNEVADRFNDRSYVLRNMEAIEEVILYLGI